MAASDVDVSIWCFHFRGVRRRSGHRLVRWYRTGRRVITIAHLVLVTWRVAEVLENTERCGVSDGDATKASDACFRARGAYWTASDAACGASGEEHRSVRCELN
jgi:hypothetical protein